MSAREPAAAAGDGRGAKGRKVAALTRGPRPREAKAGRERVAAQVGAVLRERRRAAGVTQRMLAEWTGLSEKAVAEIERDGVPDSLIRMALALGARPSEVLADAETQVDAEAARVAELLRRESREALGLVSTRDSTRTPPFLP